MQRHLPGHHPSEVPEPDRADPDVFFFFFIILAGRKEVVGVHERNRAKRCVCSKNRKQRWSPDRQETEEVEGICL